MAKASTTGNESRIDRAAPRPESTTRPAVDAALQAAMVDVWIRHRKPWIMAQHGIAGIVLCVMAWPADATLHCTVYIAVAIAVVLHGVHLRHRYLRDPDPTARAALWHRGIVVHGWATGGMWAFGLVSIYGADLDSQAILVPLVLAGMSAGVIAGWSSILPSVYGFHIPAITGFVAINLLHYTPTHALWSGLSTVFVAVMLTYAHQLNHRLVEAHRVRLERDAIIHDLMRTRDALQSAVHQAQEANRAKSDFLAMMSHELRTPLNAIIGFAEIIERQMFGSVGNPRYSQYAIDIRSSGEHLLSVINDVLDMSKIEAGRLDLSEDRLDLARSIDGALSMMRGRVADSGLTLITDVAPDLPALWADERAVRQMLINLISNAVKFTPRGGSITVGVRLPPEGELALFVQDTGIGIPEDQQAEVLEPFHQSQPSLTSGSGGTGLGLSIVRALMTLHGGSICLESRVGDGTTVTCVFPADRVGRSSEPPMVRPNQAAE